MQRYGAERGGWRKYEDNPVFGNAERGTCFDVHVHKIPTGFRMYFSWRPKCSVAVMESPDGIHWSEPVIQLTPRASGWEDDAINRNSVVFRNGVYRMWYTGQVFFKVSKIGYAVSSDGIHFERPGNLPVLEPELEWEKDSVMNPFVLFDEKRNCYRMWYAGGEQYEPNALGYAESTDGIHWKKDARNPIFVKGTEPYDQNRVGGCEVVPLPDGRFAMFYIGYENIDLARICCAVSPDGITDWVRLPFNPVLSPDEGCWDHDACYKPSLQFDETNDRWLLWYNGRRVHDEYIGLAIHDGKDLLNGWNGKR